MRVLATIVGLGNIGSQYECTRHNIGFSIIDFLLEDIKKEGYFIQNISTKFIEGSLWKIHSPNGIIFLCKPSTYMNLSGKCVSSLLSYYSLPLSSLLVIHDELDIPFGTYRIKHGGGDAGHNGLRSISSQLNTQMYTRLRIGIGRPPIKEYDITHWVLGKFTKEEQQTLITLLPHFLECITAFIEGGFEKAKHERNRKTK